MPSATSVHCAGRRTTPSGPRPPEHRLECSAQSTRVLGIRDGGSCVIPWGQAFPPSPRGETRDCGAFPPRRHGSPGDREEVYSRAFSPGTPVLHAVIEIITLPADYTGNNTGCPRERRPTELKSGVGVVRAVRMMLLPASRPADGNSVDLPNSIATF